LFGCNTAPGDSGAEGATASTAGALEIAAAAAVVPAQPAGIELFAQTPYEFQTGRFDLDLVDDMNSEPLLRQRLEIPYDDLEKTIRAGLDKLRETPIEGTVDGPGAAHTY